MSNVQVDDFTKVTTLADGDLIHIKRASDNSDVAITKESLDGIYSNSSYTLQSAAFTAVLGRQYYCSTNMTVTMPSTTGVTAGQSIKFYKPRNVTVTINRNGGNNENFLFQAQTDTSVIYDIDSEITITFNGTNWRVH